MDNRKKLVPKKNGELYNVSPWALNWDDENYYLIGYDNVAGRVKFYRVDKIKKITILEENERAESILKNLIPQISLKRPLVCLQEMSR